MAAITRWVQYDPTSVGHAGDGNLNGCKGTRGYLIGTAEGLSDAFDIGPTTNKLYVNIDGAGTETITLYSGSDLDPRFIARDISEKLKLLYPYETNPGDESINHATCEWGNWYGSSNNYNNRFRIYSGTTGSDSSVTVISGANSAIDVLGWGTQAQVNGTANHEAGAYGFAGTCTVTGTYYGLLDELYKVVISVDDTRGIGTPTKGGSNTYDGTFATGGCYNHSTSNCTYVISINIEGVGSTMGGGTGNVPLMSWTSTLDDDTDTGEEVELLYPDHWYAVGHYGLMVKFTDAVFNTVDPAWTIVCTKPQYSYGTNLTAAVGDGVTAGGAKYVWSSSRGDNSSAALITSSGTPTRLGSRGVEIAFTSGTFTAGDTFYIPCVGPQPINYNIASLNYGNVTVSTESALKSVVFEVESGAVEVSTVKFGLESHGNFQHHDAGLDDTYFRFGTMGPSIGHTGTTSGETNGVEWHPGVTALILSGTPGAVALYSTDPNLLVVSTADASKPVGAAGLMSDPIWLNIKLGTNETGANSSINQRLYFDYS